MDFRAFYESARLWATGATPYGSGAIDIPNLTPPFMLPLWLPFARLSFGTAREVWFLFSILLLASCVPVISDRARLLRRDTALIILGSTPALIGLAHGQVSFVLMFAMTAAWSAAHRQQHARSGGWLGFLCAVKPFYGLFGLWLVARRDWRGVTAMCSVFGVLTIGGLLVVGPTNTTEWLSRLGDVSWQGHLYNVSAVGVGARLFGPRVTLAAATWTPLIVSRGLALATNALLMLLVGWFTLAAVRREDIDASFAALGLAGLLLSPLGWVHYVPAVAGPLFARFSRHRSVLVWVAAALAMLPYQLMVNASYGRIGTLIVGQWAFLLSMILLAGVATSRSATNDQRARTSGKVGSVTAAG
jgi:hypothetical protein